MNTWLTDITRKTNERLFADGDLTRMTEYFATVPARLKLGEELEKLEPTLTKALHAELARRHPDRPLYSRRFAQDLVEGLRHLNRAVLADEPRLLHARWTDHLVRVLAAVDIDSGEARDAYAVLRELLERQLTRSAWEVARPTFDDMTESLTGHALPA
jgi:Phycobilisome protein